MAAAKVLQAVNGPAGAATDFIVSAHDALFGKGSPSSAQWQQNILKQRMAFYQSQGLTKDQAAGMLANAYAESGLDPNAVNPKSGAYGLFQWLGSRKDALFKKYGKNPTAAQQYQFAWDELKSSESKSLIDLKNAKGAFGAGKGFDVDFERNGGNWYSQFVRGTNAQMIAGRYNSTAGVPASAQAILAGLRAHQATKATANTTTVHVQVGGVTVNPKDADASSVVKQAGKQLSAAITARLGATGLA